MPQSLKRVNTWGECLNYSIKHTVQSVLDSLNNIENKNMSSCGAGSCNCGGGCNGECATGGECEQW